MFKTITSRQPTTPPAWAVLERQLIAAMNEAAPLFVKKYTRPGGTLIWRKDYPGDGVWADDLYEAFFNWPLFFALGGSNYIGETAVEEWNAITRQIEHDYGRIHKEFTCNDDWFHNSENYVYFYNLGMADPTNAEMVRRARRFAGFYLNEDPAAPNYDPEHHIIRSPFNGSKGPLFHARYDDVEYNLLHGHTTLGPGYTLPPKWQEDKQLREQVHARFDDVVMRGDVVVNLGVVGLMTCAYLYTGDEKYKRWVVGYVNAWMDRIEKNGGVIPDNVGLGGRVGENRGGQWWGGFYGWTGLYSLQMMGSAMMLAAECAQLLTGDARYLNLIRSQLEVLIRHGKEESGKLLVPTKHTDAGWSDWGGLPPLLPIHLWSASMSEGDRRYMERFRKGNESEWQTVSPRGPRAVDDRAWAMYLAGNNPGYPEQILQANYREVCRRVEMILHDQADLRHVDEHHWQVRNPVLTEALVHLTTGAPQSIYWGGLAQGRVRYFDGERPGLPADVAALVTGLGPDSMELTLVNLNVCVAREVLVGAGSFGEHQFLAVQTQDDRVEVNDRCFQVRLLPGTQIELKIQMRRYCNPPTYAFPWHGQAIPSR